MRGRRTTGDDRGRTHTHKKKEEPVAATDWMASSYLGLIVSIEETTGIVKSSVLLRERIYSVPTEYILHLRGIHKLEQ